MNQPDQTPLRVLVVEDDPVAGELISRHLLGAGYRVTMAHGAIEALKVLADQGADMVVSDWIMPEVDGVEFCLRLRQQEELGNLYFIMVTVHTDKSKLTEAFVAGVNDYISKPFDEGELLARVGAGARIVRLQQQLTAFNQQAQLTAVELAVLNNRLHQAATTDELTGLCNRRHAMARLREQWTLARRESTPLSCFIIDADGFKQVNDTCGHRSGDEVLAQVARTLLAACRSGDVVARLGGDEFMVVSLSLALDEAAALADKLCRRIAEIPWNRDATHPKVTASIGVTQDRPALSDPDALVRLADNALYAAKAAGRNTYRITS